VVSVRIIFERRLQEKFGGVKTRILKGFLGKTWSETWCFGGVVVVRCVVDMVFWMVYFVVLKM
jgi:hypothetical protein